ncbi:hypothetical protein L195_g018005 [Trifolium pratense]|uniref:Uncharacterized protein n=1 Tax=Trifolium pratense TaxID=57577 RepID=A0A2K3MVR7_TRIPR|nr:hypothetical protein L195_g018005 [Trifolium pratense]
MKTPSPAQLVSPCYFTCLPNVTDQWVWRPDPGGGYSMQSCSLLGSFRMWRLQQT